MKKTLLCGILLLALASCTTFVPNPHYSPDSQLQGRSFEVVGEVKPIQIDRKQEGPMVEKGLKNIILEKAKAQFGNVDDVINIRSVIKKDAFLQIPEYVLYEATAIRYTD